MIPIESHHTQRADDATMAEARAPLPDVAPETPSAATEPTEDQNAPRGDMGISAAFDRGMRDYEEDLAHGLDGRSCPYSLDDPRSQHWLRGYNAGAENDGPSAVMGIATSEAPANDELIDDDELPF